MFENESLYLRELKDNADKLGKLLLGLFSNLICELETIKGDVYKISIQ